MAPCRCHVVRSMGLWSGGYKEKQVRVCITQPDVPTRHHTDRVMGSLKEVNDECGVHVCAQATILEAYEQLIDSAQHLVYIESPFFISGLQVRTFNSCFDSCATGPVPVILHPDLRLLSWHVVCARAMASSRTVSPK